MVPAVVAVVVAAAVTRAHVLEHMPKFDERCRAFHQLSLNHSNIH